MTQNKEALLRILIADDEQWIRAGVKTLLQSQTDLTVVGEAQNGEEAVRLAEQMRPDLVLIDIAMPVMNGLEATRKIKERQPQTKVVVLTVHEEPAYQRVARAFGADAFIVKKRMVRELVGTIRELA